jgi:hypothetical protein
VQGNASKKELSNSRSDSLLISPAAGQGQLFKAEYDYNADEATSIDCPGDQLATGPDHDYNLPAVHYGMITLEIR